MVARSRRKAREMELTRGLVLAARQWRRLGGETAKRHGVSEAALYPLILLGRMGGTRQNVLAEAVGIEGPSLVRLVDQLEQARLLRRMEDPSDRRAKILSLTAAGQAKVGEIEQELEALRAEVFVALSEQDLDAASRIFAAIEGAPASPGADGLGETAP